MYYAVFQPTKPEAVKDLVPLIKDKKVYDIGAGNGAFAEEMSKYADVTAIETDEYLAKQCRLRGLETIEGDFMDIDFRDAEVIYIFMSYLGNYNLTRKLKDWDGIVISALYPLFKDISTPYKPDAIIHSTNIAFNIYDTRNI